MPLLSGNEPRSEKTFDFAGFLESLDSLSRDAGEVYYLPATRSGLMQSHTVIASSLVARATRAGFEPSPEAPMLPGGMSDFLQQIILYKSNKKPDNEMMAIADALESSVLYGKIIWKPSPSGYPDFVYYSREMGEEIRLSQASSMVSELAPLVCLSEDLSPLAIRLSLKNPKHICILVPKQKSPLL